MPVSCSTLKCLKCTEIVKHPSFFGLSNSCFTHESFLSLAKNHSEVIPAVIIVDNLFRNEDNEASACLLRLLFDEKANNRPVLG